MGMRVVFFSDTHLGLDTPARPRVDRRRRGEDFFDNFERVLSFAAAERVSLVLHGGDLFFRSRVPPFIVDRVYQRLLRFADGGVCVGLIAGNHERSVLPPSLLLAHPRIHVFAAPSTHVFDVDGGTLAVTGVPFIGDGARFVGSLHGAHASHAASAGGGGADAHVLLAHEAFDGAACGPGDFVFRARGPGTGGHADVVPVGPLPNRFDAVLSGHIHRRQVLWRARRRPDERRVPVIYAGSVERTSFAEMGEQKAFAVIELNGAGAGGRVRFVPLPARPMLDVGAPRDDDDDDDDDALFAALAGVPDDAIVRVTCDEALAVRVRAWARGGGTRATLAFAGRVSGGPRR